MKSEKLPRTNSFGIIRGKQLKNQNWGKVKLKEVLAESPQYGYTTSAQEKKVGPKLLRITDIQAHIVCWENVPYCKINENEKEKYLLKQEDLLFSRTGASTGTNYFVKNLPSEESIFASYLIRIRADKRKCVPEYLAYFFKSPLYWGQINGFLSGSAQPGINATTLQELEFLIPESLEEQKRIAEILSAFDDKIELNNKINQNLEQTAQAIFKEWFVSPSEDLAKEGGLPKGWKVKNIMEIIKRLPVSKRYDNRTALPKGKIPILDQGQSGIIGFHNEEPSIKASIKNPVAVFSNHTCYYRLITFDFSCIQNVIPYIGINGYPTLFVYYLTRNKIKMSDYKGHWPEFAAQKFIVPPPELAVKFPQKAQPFIENISKNERENQTLSALRDLFLPKLMNGEMRI